MANNIKEIVLTIDGDKITVPHEMSAIQAVWHSGKAMVMGVGCLEGVCGACKVMVKRKDSRAITTELGCQTVVEDGMEVFFITYTPENHHSYNLKDFDNSWELESKFNSIFHEASHCRHCGGCDTACPKDIEVEKVVNLAVEGKFLEASELFETCVMCGLCLTSCPERITPNHVGLFSRRVSSFFHMRPSNLINRIDEIEKGKLTVETKKAK